MDAIEALLTRRSVRRFRPESVTPQEIDTLLRAAMQAPSAMNEQPWEFVVVTERRTLDRIPDAHPHAAMAREAAAAIVICSDKRRWAHEGSWSQGCAAATENILIAAHALGLGSVWVGIYPIKDRVRGIRSLLAIPDHIMPFSLIPLGRPFDSQPPKSRYSAARVHPERW